MEIYKHLVYFYGFIFDMEIMNRWKMKTFILKSLYNILTIVKCLPWAFVFCANLHNKCFFRFNVVYAGCSFMHIVIWYNNFVEAVWLFSWMEKCWHVRLDILTVSSQHMSLSRTNMLKERKRDALWLQCKF